LDEIEKSAPDLIRAETAPFSSRQGEGEITDSLVNAAAMHHRPETLLQWIIATADRVASGFEREDFETYNNAEENHIGRNHFQSRLWTLFEQVRLAENAKRPDAAADFHWRYRLQPLSPKNIFPVKRDGYEPSQNEPAQAEYRALWEDFLKALEKIPKSHRQQWPLWLDHLDTLWQSYTHAIPSSTFGKNKPEVSLYDHSKATAAFAVALWRWHVAQDNLSDVDAIRQHKDRADWDEKKFLLVQGDFFGIQDFIFSEGAETNKKAAKLLRGRSFQVSLFTELTALKVLEACELPSSSQIINAAGKFLIVAPNTPAIREKLENVRQELNQWFLEHTFGLAGLGLVGKPASCSDFLQDRFKGLMTALFEDLETAKLSRFALTDDAPRVFAVEYPQGVCAYNTRLPADAEGSAPLSRDQIAIGEALAGKNRLLVVRDEAELRKGSVKRLEVPVFGYRIGFTEDEDVTGKFGALAQSGGLVRCWDFSFPQNLKESLWHGYARRYINAHVPVFGEHDYLTSDKYRGVEEDEDCRPGNPKTFNYLACEDRAPDGDGNWLGQIALATLKGDVDNLGLIFQKGLAHNTFAKMAALSRQMNAFFAVWLPAYCKEKYPNTYTVFAGGDDFFLIGPWRSTQKLAAEMSEHFKAFVAENPEIHFSVGMVTTKPGYPVHALAEQAETALEKAKGYERTEGEKKNAVCLYNEVVPWSEWKVLTGLEQEIRELADTYRLSTGYVYGLLSLIDLATDKSNTESAMWRSRFVYRTRRYVVDKLPAEARNTAQIRLADTFGERGIAKQKNRFRIPLFNFFYSKRRG
jgi:CRISPR-associated protein Csm1